MKKVLYDAEAREDGGMNRREDGTHSRLSIMGEEQKAKLQQ